jgi:hypothetical protein
MPATPTSTPVHQPSRECAGGVGLFQKSVTTDSRLRFRNQDRLRQFVIEHPEVRVFAAHDPGALPQPEVDQRTGDCQKTGSSPADEAV